MSNTWAASRPLVNSASRKGPSLLAISAVHTVGSHFRLPKQLGGPHFTMVRSVLSEAGPSMLVSLPPPTQAYNAAMPQALGVPKIAILGPLSPQTQASQGPTRRAIPFPKPKLVYVDTQAESDSARLSIQPFGQRNSKRERSKASDVLPDLAQDLSTKLGSLSTLRTALGLDGIVDTIDTSLVAIDTETERRGSTSRVVEVGITILNTRDIRGLDPGRYAEQWMSRAKHHHVVVNTSRFARRRMRSNLFGKSLLLTGYETGAAIEWLWSSLGTDVAVIGHSVLCDVVNLARDPELRVNLPEVSSKSGMVERVYDTYYLAQGAQKQGLNFSSFRLGQVIRKLGPNPGYVYGKTVRGCHNAGNDAAYTMMAALLLALRSGPAKMQRVGTQDESNETTWTRNLLRQVPLLWLTRILENISRGFKGH